MNLEQAQAEIRKHCFTTQGRLNSAMLRRDSFKQSPLASFIFNATTEMKPETTLAGRIYSVLAGIPRCPVCQAKPIGYFNRLLSTCADAACISTAITEKRLASLQAKYGMKVSPNSLQKIKERVGNLNKKGRETLLAKHGVTNAFLLPDVKQRAVAGLQAHFSSYDGNENRKQLWSERFSVTVDEIVDKDSSFVRFTCPTCNKQEIKTFYALVHRMRQLGNVCAHCTGFVGGSIEQLKLYQEVLKLAPDAVLNDRAQITPYELDIYVPTHKIAIEYHGIFWHSDGLNDELDAKCHLHKHMRCKAAGIRLLQFTSLDSTEKALSIIQHALGLSTRIFARKCVFKGVPAAIAKNALLSWHLNRETLSCRQAFGLYYEDQLVQIATFGRARFSDDKLELYRLASAPGVAVVGGLSKLLRNALAALDKTELITYADKFLGGASYLEAGLELIGDTPPGYFYYEPKSERVVSRYQAQKHLLSKLLGDKFDPAQSERMNMLSAGYRIFSTAGNYKYKLVYK